MSTEIAIRESWWTRFLSVFRAAPPSPLPQTFAAGGDFVPGIETWPEFDPNSAMAAYAIFPWLYAASSAVASDLSGLPLILTQGEGAKARRIDKHPVLDLLRKPSQRINGPSFRAQLLIDRALSGNAYALMLGQRRGQPTSLLRLHPSRVTPVPDTDGQPLEYIYHGAGTNTRYPWDAVQQIAGPSWEDGPQGLYGTGWIRSLVEYLNADSAAWKRQANAQKRGRPEAIVSPDSKDAAGNRWDAKQIREIRRNVEALMSAATGGIAILPDGMKLDPLSWSPANLESHQLHQDVREAIGAVTGVPPARLSEVTANFATQREQMQSYWDCTVKGFAREFEAVYDDIASRWSDDLHVHHDYSQVAPLRAQRTDSVNRANALWMMGVPLVQALTTEGLADAIPEGGIREDEEPTDVPDMAPTPDEEALVDWLTKSEPPAALVPEARAFAAPKTEEARASMWRSFVSDLHKPGERRMTTATLRYLKGSAKRIAERMGVTLEGKSFDGQIRKDYSTDSAALDSILGAAIEDAELRRILTPEMQRIAREAFLRAADQMGVAMDWSPWRDSVATHLDKLSPQVLQTTRDAIERIILGGNANGLSIQEMQAQLLTASEFSPMRALRVARTETTRQAGAGAVQAYQDASGTGLKVKKGWLSARDEAVRDKHAELDGQEVDVDEPFVVPSTGESGQYPGDFESADMVVNDRCTTYPVVED